MSVELDLTQERVKQWLADVGIEHTDGGVTGPALSWAVSMAFGGSTHVSVAYDLRHLRRLEVISDLAIAEDHKAAYVRLGQSERAALDRRLLGVLLRRSTISFHVFRDDRGAPEKIAMRGFLPTEGMTPGALVGAIHDARNATMELRLAFQEAFGPGSGQPLDRALTDPGYANVVLHRGTLESLDAFQIPGETLDETILRAIRD